MLPGPRTRQFDAPAKIGLTKRAAQLFRVLVAHWRRRHVSIQPDRLSRRWTRGPKRFGHKYPSSRFVERSVRGRVAKPSRRNTRISPTIASICARGPGRSTSSGLHPREVGRCHDDAYCRLGAWPQNRDRGKTVRPDRVQPVLVVTRRRCSSGSPAFCARTRCERSTTRTSISYGGTCPREPRSEAVG